MAIEQNQVGSPDIPQWMLKAAGIKDMDDLKSLPEERLAKLNDWAVNNSLSYSNAIKNAEDRGIQSLSVRGGSISLSQARDRMQQYDQFRAVVMNEAQQRWNRDEFNRAMEKTVTYPAWMLQQNGMRSISSSDDDKLVKAKAWAEQNHDVFRKSSTSSSNVVTLGSGIGVLGVSGVDGVSGVEAASTVNVPAT